MLCGLYPAKENHEKTAEAIAADVRSTLESEMPAVLSKESISIIESRVRKLLSINKGIAVTAKASDVATEHKNVCCTSKIFSDIRPIFSATADEIMGAVVIHNLNISYHTEGDVREFFVALNADDLTEIKDVVERAEKKAMQMKLALSRAGIAHLGEED